MWEYCCWRQVVLHILLLATTTLLSNCNRLHLLNSCKAVVRQLSGSCQAVFGQLSSCCQAVSTSFQALFRKFSGSFLCQTKVSKFQNDFINSFWNLLTFIGYCYLNIDIWIFVRTRASNSTILSTLKETYSAL